MLPTNDADFKQQLTSLERFFTQTSGGGFLFAVANDELLQAKINQGLQFLLQGKSKELRIHSLQQQVLEVAPLAQLQQLLQQHQSTRGLILTDLEPALKANPHLLTQLNFAREGLSQLQVPILFWLNSRTVALMHQQASDLYDQRVSSNIYIDATLQTVDDSRFEQYKAVQVAKDNADLQQYQARLALLQNQLNEAEKQGLPKETIANDIVTELFRIYVELPDMSNAIKDLLYKYKESFDYTNPDIIFSLARINSYLGELQATILLYKEALDKYKYFSIKSPYKYLRNIADTINNLAIIHNKNNNLQEAEIEFIEALTLYRKLLPENENEYLPSIGGTLNNLANLHRKKNQFELAVSEYEESLNIFRKLAIKDPQKYLPVIAMNLNNIANLFLDKNDFSYSAKYFDEALLIYRDLARSNPQAYLTNVAMMLNNLGNLHRRENKLEQAKEEYTNSLIIYKQLATSNSLEYSNYVAGTLNNLAVLYHKDNKLLLSKETYLESLKIRRQLAKSNPNAYLPGLAMTLNNIANLHIKNSDFSSALDKYNEALSIYQSLVLINKLAYMPYLSMIQTNMAIFYQVNEPNKPKSISYAKDALQSAYSFINTVPAVNEYFYNALDVVKKWGLDEQAFLQEALAEMEAQPPPSASNS